jgi:hypothetical protein
VFEQPIVATVRKARNAYVRSGILRSALSGLFILFLHFLLERRYLTASFKNQLLLDETENGVPKELQQGKMPSIRPKISTVLKPILSINCHFILT